MWAYIKFTEQRLGGRSNQALRLRKRITMKNILLISIVSLALLQPVVEAIFLGPIAVGVALGAVAVGKGLILGSILSQRRTTHKSGRSYTRYNRREHYSQPRTYYKQYTQPKTVSRNIRVNKTLGK